MEVNEKAKILREEDEVDDQNCFYKFLDKHNLTKKYEGAVRFSYTCSYIGEAFINFKICYDVFMLGNGLVVGPVSYVMRSLLLTFSFISAVDMILEIVLTAWYFYSEKEIKGEFSVLLQYIFDTQVHCWLNVALAVCAEYTISTYQMIKGITSLFSPGIFMVVNIHRLRVNAPAVGTNNIRTTKCLQITRVLTVIVAALQLIGSLLLVVMTYIRYDAGEMIWRAPIHTFTESQDVRNMQKYLDDVCIFYNSDKSFGSQAGQEFHSSGWLSVASIYDVIEHPNNLEVKVTYNNEHLTVIRGAGNTHWCFSASGSGSFINKWCTKDDEVNIANGTTHKFNFQFEKPGAKHLFGNIIYTTNTQSSPRLRYFRSGAPCTQVMRHYDTRNGSRYIGYSLKELVDIHEIWRCGWARCTTTSRDGPEKVEHLHFSQHLR